jgi:hypothetical protein
MKQLQSITSREEFMEITINKIEEKKLKKAKKDVVEILSL